MAQSRYLTEDKFLSCMRVLVSRVYNSSVAEELESAIRDTLLNVGHFQPTELQQYNQQQQQQQQSLQQTPQHNVVTTVSQQDAEKPGLQTQTQGTEKKVRKQSKANLRTIFWKIYFFTFKQRQYTGNSLTGVSNAWKWFNSQQALMDDLQSKYGQLIDIMNENNTNKSNRDQQFWTWVEQNRLQQYFDKYVPEAQVIADFINGLSPDNTQAEQQHQLSNGVEHEDEEFHVQHESQNTPHSQNQQKTDQGLKQSSISFDQKIQLNNHVSTPQLSSQQQIQQTPTKQQEILSDDSERKRKKREQKKLKKQQENGILQNSGQQEGAQGSPQMNNQLTQQQQQQQQMIGSQGGSQKEQQQQIIDLQQDSVQRDQKVQRKHDEDETDQDRVTSADGKSKKKSKKKKHRKGDDGEDEGRERKKKKKEKIQEV